jgi:hypothetical protein
MAVALIGPKVSPVRIFLSRQLANGSVVFRLLLGVPLFVS